MARKTAARRAELRSKLIEIAERTIAVQGLSALRARDLAKEADCATGAIYNVFGDLGELTLEVNARTFKRLGAAVAEDLAAAPTDPTQQLIVMAQAYHHFAAANHNSWRALFDLPRAPGEAAPEWYLEEMGQLFTYIAGPLTALRPALGEGEISDLTRALFSAVHGIVLLGLDDASAGVGRDDIDRMIALVLGNLA